MKTSILIIIISLFTSLSYHSEAQTKEKKAVIEVIQQMFDGMRESDSAKVAQSFTRNAIMQTIGKSPEGNTKLNNGNLAGFLKAVGTSKNEIWDEQIQHYEINIDGKLASAWTPYHFYRGEEFSHCGVNSFQLIKKEDGWKIFFIVDTRRQENCLN